MILYFFLATQALPKSVAYYFEHLCMLFGFEGELDTILFFASGCRSHCGGGSLTSSAMGIKVNLSWCPDYCASRGLYGFKPAPTSLITEAENPGLEESTAIFDWENKSSQNEVYLLFFTPCAPKVSNSYFKRLDGLVTSFLWSTSPLRIGLKVLQEPWGQGGLALLDWYKYYLAGQMVFARRWLLEDNSDSVTVLEAAVLGSYESLRLAVFQENQSVLQ